MHHKKLIWMISSLVTDVTEAPFTRVRTNLCTDKNLHSSTLRLHGTGGTERIFERLSVQVWDLKKTVNVLTGTVPYLYRLVQTPEPCNFLLR